MNALHDFFQAVRFRQITGIDLEGEKASAAVHRMEAQGPHDRDRQLKRRHENEGFIPHGNTSR